MFRRLSSVAFLVFTLFGFGGCGAVDSVSSGISAINPFSKDDEVIPGERQPVFPDGTDAAAVSETGVALAVAAPSQRSDWVQGGGTLTNNPGHVALRSGGTLGRAWQSGATTSFGVDLSMGKPDQRVFSRPLVADGRVFVYSPDGQVTALSLSSGASLWKASLRPEKERDVASGGGIAVEGGVVYAATGYGKLAALNAANGSQVWSIELHAPAQGAPAAGGGHVFVVLQDNTLLAVKQSDGAEAWRYEGIPELAGLLGAANPAISGNTVVVPYRSGELAAFNIDSGEPIWADAVSRASRTWAISGLNDVSASPVIVDGVVYATGVGGRVIAVSLKDGERLWEADVGSTHTPVVSGDALFLLSVDSRAIGIDRRSGRIAWSRQLPVGKKKKKRLVWAGPVLAGNALWFVSAAGELASVNPANGAIIAINKMNDPSYVAPVAVAGRLLVVSDNGQIVAYQ